uniref:Uncharacterized protein n=1 Tax=mine drainage metagenome TaxID=410659 RepID=E6PDP0_9ZZZZ
MLPPPAYQRGSLPRLFTLTGLRSHLGVSFTLICFQRLSDPNVATRPCSWRNNRFTSGSFDSVLSY